MSELISRGRIVDIARRWIGTPYCHQASLIGVGADCVGLIRGVYRELYGSEPPVSLSYTPDEGDANGHEGVVEAGRQYLREISILDATDGDVVTLRWTRGSVAKHAAILATGGSTLIHAYSRMSVCEVNVSEWWHRRITNAFSFPGLVD